MDIGFRKLKLAHKLFLLFGLPLFITIGFLATVFPQNILEHPVAFSILLAAVIGCGILTIYFIQMLANQIKTIDTASKQLAAGNFDPSISLNGFKETSQIGMHIDLIRNDVVMQAQFAEQIRSGKLQTPYTLRHEQDILGKALMDIQQNLITIKQADEQRNWASEGLAKFVEVLQSGKDLKSISNDIIVNLVRIINGNQGAIFLLTKDESEVECLEMKACYAFNRTKHITHRVSVGEGLIGQAFLEKETIHLKEVPQDFIRITSGLGEANPRFVLIVPLKMNEIVMGIIELASFREFMKHEIAFVEKIGESIAYTVSSIRSAEYAQRMVDELHGQTEQMRAQEEELRQNQEELQATQETISRKYEALFKKLSELNYQSKFDQLRSITSTKKRNVEYYFDIIRNQILTFAEDRMIIEAVKALKDSFYKLGVSTSDEQKELQRESLSAYYITEFLPRLNDNTNLIADSSKFIPSSDRVTELQYLYISNNPHPTGKKSLLNDSNDGSEYSQVHALYHPILRNFLEKFGYYDIFLIDVKTGDMVYSVFKEVDFATSLVNGLYHATNFGKVVKKAIESSERNFVHLIDFEPYDPSYHSPASFIAAPIYNGNEKIGILVFQMPINKINQILTGNNKWREDGLGESGETFMLGGDYKLRSISRQLIENIDDHLESLQKQQYDKTLLQQIRKMETSILMEEIRQESVTHALNGITGTKLERNSKGVEVLTSYAPLEIPDVHWIIMSTMNEAEASTPINNLKDGNFE